MPDIVITIKATDRNLAVLHSVSLICLGKLAEAGHLSSEILGKSIVCMDAFRQHSLAELMLPLREVFSEAAISFEVEPKVLAPSPAPAPAAAPEAAIKTEPPPGTGPGPGAESPPVGYKSALPQGLVAIDWWTLGVGPVEAFEDLDADTRLKHWPLLTDEVQKRITAARKPLGSAAPAKVKPAPPSPPPPETSIPAETSTPEPVDIVPAGYSQALPAGTEPVAWLELEGEALFKAYTALNRDLVLVHWKAMSQAVKDLVAAAIKAHDDPITKRAVTVRVAWNEQATPAEKLNWAMRVQAGLPYAPIEAARELAGWVNGLLINELAPEVLEKYALCLGEWRLGNGYALPMKPTPPAMPVSKRPKAGSR